MSKTTTVKIECDGCWEEISSNENISIHRNTLILCAAGPGSYSLAGEDGHFSNIDCLKLWEDGHFCDIKCLKLWVKDK